PAPSTTTIPLCSVMPRVTPSLMPAHSYPRARARRFAGAHGRERRATTRHVPRSGAFHVDPAAALLHVLTRERSRSPPARGGARPGGCATGARDARIDGLPASIQPGRAAPIGRAGTAPPSRTGTRGAEALGQWVERRVRRKSYPRSVRRRITPGHARPMLVEVRSNGSLREVRHADAARSFPSG